MPYCLFGRFNNLGRLSCITPLLPLFPPPGSAATTLTSSLPDHWPCLTFFCSGLHSLPRRLILPSNPLLRKKCGMNFHESWHPSGSGSLARRVTLQFYLHNYSPLFSSRSTPHLGILLTLTSFPRRSALLYMSAHYRRVIAPHNLH